MHALLITLITSKNKCTDKYVLIRRPRKKEEENVHCYYWKFWKCPPSQKKHNENLGDKEKVLYVRRNYPKTARFYFF